MNRQFFETDNAVGQVQQEAKDSSLEHWEIEKVTFGDGKETFGLYTNVRGAEFHMKGYCSSEAITAFNHAKRTLLGLIKISRPVFTIKGLDKRLWALDRILWGFVSPYILKAEYMQPMSRELKWMTYTFLKELGISEKMSSRFGKMFSHVFEYDSAYRYRLQDLVAEVSLYELRDYPIREIRRLAKINKERDDERVAKTFTLLSNLICLSLLIPKVRRAFKKSLMGDFSNLKFDYSDIYWILLKPDHPREYKWFGKSYEERQQMLKDKGWKRPQSIV